MGLQVGDMIRNANWQTGTIEAIQFVPQPQTMYNLTIAVAHTYFVGQGQWLVHNDCPPGEIVEQAARRYAGQFGREVASTSAVYDEVTGNFYYATNGMPYPDQIAPELAARFPLAPGASHGRPPIHCSECQALNAALIDEAAPSNLHVYTLRPRTGNPLPRCPNCQVTVPDEWGITVWSD